AVTAARTTSLIRRAAAPAVEAAAWALSRAWGLTNDTAGSVPSRRAWPNRAASAMWARRAGDSMIAFTYWKGLWWGTRPASTALAPSPQPLAYQRHVTPAASSRSAMVGAVWGARGMRSERWGGYGGSRLLTTRPAGSTSPSLTTRPSAPISARSAAGASGNTASAPEISSKWLANEPPWTPWK